MARYSSTIRLVRRILFSARCSSCVEWATSASRARQGMDLAQLIEESFLDMQLEKDMQLKSDCRAISLRIWRSSLLTRIVPT
jgi:hypothetical protein